MKGRETMKIFICLACALLMLTLLVPAKQADAFRGFGWVLPGLIVGGAIGWSLAPRYYYPPAYYYPPPAYYYPAPPSYTYPPPAYSAPPAGDARETPSAGGQVFIYPRQGQSPEKQTADRNECQTWAMNQTGVDLTKPPPTGMSAAQQAQKSGDYYRALEACMDGRGYTLR